MDDLITWLRAQLDEDERVARTAGGTRPEWTFSPSSGEGHMWTGATVWSIGLSGVHGDGFLDDEAGEHIARHDPARVLAEVEAKRRILDLHAVEDDGGGGGPYCLNCHGDRGYSDRPMPCATVRLLALPYADRPGYREEWRP